MNQTSQPVTNTDSIDSLTQRILMHIQERGWQPTQRGLAISITLEAAELLDHYQWEETPRPGDEDNIPSEVADIMIYLVQFCAKRNIDLGQAVIDKLAVAAQKYPAGQSTAEHYKGKLAHRQAK